MKLNISRTALLCGLAAATSVLAQETVFLGTLTSQAAVGLPNTHHNKGDFLLGQTIFDGTKFNENVISIHSPREG